MSALSIQIPFPVFQNRDGQPLDNGYVWIGQLNLNPQTNPVQVYFDRAQTQLAQQPLRTINGYVSNAGTPAQLYINEMNFSILVQDKNGSMVYNFPDGNVILLDAGDITFTGFKNQSGFVSDLADNDGSDWIGFEPTGTGVVARSAQDKLRETVSVQDFGAVGDGIADDTVALTNALNSSSNVLIDGSSKTYKITAPIAVTTQNITVQNMTIDMSAVPAQPGNDFIVKFEGTQGTAVNLTSDLLANTNVVRVSDTSTFVVEGYVWLQSNTAFWSTLPLGQYAKVKSIDSPTQLTLYDNVLYDFTTISSGRIAPINTKKNLIFTNITFIGAQANIQAALYLNLCEDIVVRDCSFNSVDYTCVYVSRCVNFVADAVQCRYSRATGLSYGIVFVNGCFGGTVTNGYSEDQRHYVATGSESAKGGVNLYLTVSNNHIFAARNAGIDAHPTTDFYSIIGNNIEIAAGLTGTLDGIICQGLNCIISNNTVVNSTRHAIFHQMLPNIGSGSTIISNNTIRNGGGSSSTDTGINVINQTTGSATLNGVVISGNVIEGNNDFHILVTAQPGVVSNVAIANNVTRQPASNSSCRIYALTGSISDITITGNLFKSSGTQNLYLLGTVGFGITRLSVTGNNINGGTHGIRYSFVTFSAQVNNQFFNNINKVLIENSANVVLDTRQEGVRNLTGSPTYTVAATDVDIVANRATTITLTLPTPAEWVGRILNVKTIQNQIVNSASANVLPIDSAIASTAILPNVAGSWVQLKCDGTNWVVMQRGS